MCISSPFLTAKQQQEEQKMNTTKSSRKVCSARKRAEWYLSKSCCPCWVSSDEDSDTWLPACLCRGQGDTGGNSRHCSWGRRGCGPLETGNMLTVAHLHTLFYARTHGSLALLVLFSNPWLICTPCFIPWFICTPCFMLEPMTHLHTLFYSRTHASFAHLVLC